MLFIKKKSYFAVCLHEPFLLAEKTIVLKKSTWITLGKLFSIAIVSLRCRMKPLAICEMLKCLDNNIGELILFIFWFG